MCGRPGERGAWPSWMRSTVWLLVAMERGQDEPMRESHPQLVQWRRTAFYCDGNVCWVIPHQKEQYLKPHKGKKLQAMKFRFPLLNGTGLGQNHPSASNCLQSVLKFKARGGLVRAWRNRTGSFPRYQNIIFISSLKFTQPRNKVAVDISPKNKRCAIFLKINPYVYLQKAVQTCVEGTTIFEFNFPIWNSFRKSRLSHPLPEILFGIYISIHLCITICPAPNSRP